VRQRSLVLQIPVKTEFSPTKHYCFDTFFGFLFSEGGKIKITCLTILIFFH